MVELEEEDELDPEDVDDEEEEVVEEEDESDDLLVLDGPLSLLVFAGSVGLFLPFGSARLSVR